MTECLARCHSLPSMALLIQMAFQKPYLVQMGVKLFSAFFLGICIHHSLKCHAEAAHDYILNL